MNEYDYRKDCRKAFIIWLLNFLILYFFITKDILEIILAQLTLAVLTLYVVFKFIKPKVIQQEIEEGLNKCLEVDGQWSNKK